MKVSRSRILHCPTCDRKHNVGQLKPGRGFPCDRCLTVLIVPDDPSARWCDLADSVQTERVLRRASQAEEGEAPAKQPAPDRAMRREAASAQELEPRSKRKPKAKRKTKQPPTLFCPSCGRKFDVGGVKAGRGFPCDQCEAVLIVPEVPRSRMLRLADRKQTERVRRRMREAGVGRHTTPRPPRRRKPAAPVESSFAEGVEPVESSFAEEVEPVESSFAAGVEPVEETLPDPLPGVEETLPDPAPSVQETIDEAPSADGFDEGEVRPLVLSEPREQSVTEDDTRIDHELLDRLGEGEQQQAIDALRAAVGRGAGAAARRTIHDDRVEDDSVEDDSVEDDEYEDDEYDDDEYDDDEYDDEYDDDEYDDGKEASYVEVSVALHEHSEELEWSGAVAHLGADSSASEMPLDASAQVARAVDRAVDDLSLSMSTAYVPIGESSEVAEVSEASVHSHVDDLPLAQEEVVELDDSVESAPLGESGALVTLDLDGDAESDAADGEHKDIRTTRRAFESFYAREQKTLRKKGRPRRGRGATLRRREPGEQPRRSAPPQNLTHLFGWAALAAGLMVVLLVGYLYVSGRALQKRHRARLSAKAEPPPPPKPKPVTSRAQPVSTAATMPSGEEVELWGVISSKPAGMVEGRYGFWIATRSKGAFWVEASDDRHAKLFARLDKERRKPAPLVVSLRGRTRQMSALLEPEQLSGPLALQQVWIEVEAGSIQIETFAAFLARPQPAMN